MVPGIEQDRVILSRAITLVESNNKEHFKLAQQVITSHIALRTGRAFARYYWCAWGPVKVHFIEAFGNIAH